jgi:hypothetical protein
MNDLIAEQNRESRGRTGRSMPYPNRIDILF